MYRIKNNGNLCVIGKERCNYIFGASDFRIFLFADNQLWSLFLKLMIKNLEFFLCLDIFEY